MTIWAAFPQRWGVHPRIALLLALAACATMKEQTQAAASGFLHCPPAQVEEAAGGLYRGCGAEARCVAGSCRSNVSWQQRFDAVAKRFGAQLKCEAAQVRVSERERDYVAEGCGRHALCPLEGDCVEYLDLPTMLGRARATFSRETGCAEADVTVTYLTEGLRAVGCERAASCLSVDGPCMAIAMPSCSEVAEQRYDECLTLARGDLRAATNELNGYRVRDADVARNVQGTVAAQNMLSECRYRYEKALGSCPARQGVTR
ncbi:MAG: hypothetical protein JNK82_04345 [Myxococcaceae bacterium]|nr:hypothetical protein [Myxococcaceae bacterium]